MSSDDPRLVVIYPSQLAGKVLRVGPGRRSLGRGRAADLRLDDPHLSSIHAALSRTGGQTSVEDLGSRNGTLVNGEPVRRPRVLHDGDVLQFGRVRARYEVSGSTGMMPPARPAHEHPAGFGDDRQTGELLLGYDRLGNRLCAIGDTRITYERWGTRPRMLGRWRLEYDWFGTRLRKIGDIEVAYGRWGSLPRTLGTWEVEHRWSGEPRRIGPYEVGHYRFSDSVRTIGPLFISYDWLGTRPRRVTLPDGYRALPDGLLRALFLVLYLQEEREENRRRRAE
ncbi:FHA domain-containing protein [Herbidospora cretacea]|uniref:FHA domain-containing protein n=1 Tax=Herbidospora cretacea TaxID=28444 RepID=UPI0012DC377A|nr:FHA domain-containing protein [Herbidospora cretacea]